MKTKWTVLFESYWEAECLAWLDARPSVNGLIDRLDGRFRVLDMG